MQKGYIRMSCEVTWCFSGQELEDLRTKAEALEAEALVSPQD